MSSGKVDDLDKDFKRAIDAVSVKFNEESGTLVILVRNHLFYFLASIENNIGKIAILSL